jgi:hypothetical protein
MRRVVRVVQVQVRVRDEGDGPGREIVSGVHDAAALANLHQRAAQCIARPVEERIERGKHPAEVLLPQHEALRVRLAHAEQAGAAQREAGAERTEKGPSRDAARYTVMLFRLGIHWCCSLWFG